MGKLPENTLNMLHDLSSNHQSLLRLVVYCGCFHCKTTFSVDEIKRWIDGQQTALCPKCGIDSVIPSLALGSSIAAAYSCSPKTLEAMYDFWFNDK